MLEKAIALAVEAHKGQLDKQLDPYILHPLRVMFAVRGDLEQTVAVLHDTVEDTWVTPEYIDTLFGPTVREAVVLLTHAKGEPYNEYVSRLLHNPIARAVKYADIHDNLGRTHKLSPREQQRLIKKYTEALRLFD